MEMLKIHFQSCYNLDANIFLKMILLILMWQRIMHHENNISHIIIIGINHQNSCMQWIIKPIENCC